MAEQLKRSLRDALIPGSYLEVVPAAAAAPKIEAYLADEGFVPAEPKLAATVMLLRDAGAPAGAAGEDAGAPTPSALEVFMMRRAHTMAFVPDAVVFPGGGVHRLDYEPCPWVGPSPAEWAARMGCDEEHAAALVVAAVRELFEECGVLLAGAGEAGAQTALDVSSWQEARGQLDAHELSLSAFLRREGLVLRADLLSLQSHWVTPLYEPRRYDTCFFVARMPEGQRADGETTESSGSAWMRPGEMLDLADQGKAIVVPPTVSNLSMLARARSIDELFAGGSVPNVMLCPVVREDGTVVLRSEIS